jgi:hypothetical protein
MSKSLAITAPAAKSSIGAVCRATGFGVIATKDRNLSYKGAGVGQPPSSSDGQRDGFKSLFIGNNFERIARPIYWVLQCAIT